MEKLTTILAIDDEPLVLKLIEATFMLDSYQLFFASNGKEGLEKAKEILPDIIILDIVMPEMDGFEFCIEARKIPQLSNTPIIILTALDDRDSKIQGLESGADDYIHKPFDKIELRARIKTIIRLVNNFRFEIDKLSQKLDEKEKEIEELKKLIPNLAP